MKELIEEIAKRGWGIKLSNVFEPDSGDNPAILGGFDAEVYVGDGEYADFVYRGGNDTDPEEALKLAYTAALVGEGIA